MSLVAWYPLIDGSLENKGLDTTPLTLHGTVPFTNGRVRTAPTFSANVSNYYTMPPITKANDFSVCCWVKISADVSTSNWIVWQGVVSNNNRFGFVYLGGTNSIGFRIGSFYQNSTIEKDKWYHLCMTMNETNTVVCYINGNAVGTGLYEGYSFTENEVLYLGKSKDTSEPLNGQLQDFRYYDHCLSPKEVKEIAKGLCLHLPLKGTNARPNLFKNSATMFNYVGHCDSTLSTAELVFDETSPCGTNGKVLKLSTHRKANYPYHYAGTYYRAPETNMDKLEIGKTYCVSIWIKGDTNETSLILKNLAEEQIILKLSNEKLTPEWKRYYAIFTAKSETFTMANYLLYSTLPQTGNVNWSVCCPKLELLSPTPYIPNVDDTQYSDYVLDYEPDCSGNEFDATKYGDLTTSDSNGRYNTAVAFNGTNTYLQGLAPTNSECKEFTIATWVKLNDVSASHTIYACRTVLGGGFALFYVGAGGIRLDDGTRLDDGVRNAIFSNSTLEPNKWYHIAVTRDTTTRKLYINGNFVSSGTTTGALTNMANMYQVGESNAQTTNPIGNVLNGSLSDFRLYTSVLSADDVKELYETSVSIAHNPPSLTESAYYNYVEGQKHSTFDKSKFTIVGSPTITDDGVISSSTKNNYLTLNLNYPNSDIWEIKQEFNIAENGTEPYIGLISRGSPGFQIYSKRSEKNLTFEIGGTTGLSTFYNINYDVNYKITVKSLGGGNYQWILFNLDNGNSATKTFSGEQVYLDGAFRIGLTQSSNYGYSGSIDLKQFSITVDGVEVLSGNKTELDVVKPDNYTVVGSPVISEDGVASGFSTNSYIRKTTNISAGPEKNIIIYAKCTWNGVIPSSNACVLGGTTAYAPSVYLNTSGKWLFNLLTIAGGTLETAQIGDNYFKFELKNSVWHYSFSTDGASYIEIGTQAGSNFNNWILNIGQNLYDSSINRPYTVGSIDLNSFKIYVDGNLVYQPCLKIPYTQSKTGIKVVDSTYLDRVKDVYDQHYLERYYTTDETTQTVYEYPLFRDSIHSYEFDEGLQASITKNGIHNATTLTEATKTSIYQNNTDTVTLIEN